MASNPPAAGKPLQLAYSELQAEMLDEPGRRRKAAKMLDVVGHFLGRSDLDGLRVLDIGCSAGFIADEFRRAGAKVTGLDIDEPGLEKARQQFGDQVEFILGSADAIPRPDRSFDIVIFNHIYEHVPDPRAVVAEILRVLCDDGVVYLGLANRLGVLEPHYRLPFLSWLRKPWANQYVRLTGRGDSYYETLQTRWGLRRTFSGLSLWDYTFAVLAEPERFAAEDLVPRRLRRVPAAVWRAMSPVLPTYIWLGTPHDRQPSGPPLKASPVRIRAR